MWNKAELLYDKEGFEQLLQAFQKRLESTMITKKPTLFPKYVENVKIWNIWQNDDLEIITKLLEKAELKPQRLKEPESVSNTQLPDENKEILDSLIISVSHYNPLNLILWAATDRHHIKPTSQK